MASRAARASAGYFTRDTFRFLGELEANNNRDWFLANKNRYESSVREPFLRFIADFGPHLKKINKHFIADPRPNGGSMMRIYRDIRFSKDKSPYKTWVAANFSHESASASFQSAGFYLHLGLDHSFAAGGIWHPDPIALKKTRDFIVAKPKLWGKVLASGVEISGDAGARPPKGYSADQPFIEDLKRKDFVTSVRFKQSDVIHKDFLNQFALACASMAPLMKFLIEATGLEW